MKRLLLVFVMMGCSPRGDLDIEWIEEGRRDPTFEFHLDFTPEYDTDLHAIEIPLDRF